MQEIDETSPRQLAKKNLLQQVLAEQQNNANEESEQQMMINEIPDVLAIANNSMEEKPQGQVLGKKEGKKRKLKK